MTPLNCILSSSAIVKKDIIQFYAKNLGLDIYQDNKVTLDNNKVQKALNYSSEVKNLYEMISLVHHSAKVMMYYNENQIHRIKIMRNELQVRPVPIVDMLQSIKNVTEPFVYTLEKQKVNLIVIKKFSHSHPINIDSNLYELMLFNLV